MALAMPVRTDRWDWDYFLSVRHDVLQQWPTGAPLQDSATLEEALAYHRQQPWWKYAALRNERALQEGRVQIVPSVGHALVEQTIEHLRLSEDLKPDRWYALTDTYTRKGQFAKARDAIERSRRDGFSYLNGYPIVPHGVEGARRVNECTRAAMVTDNNDEDARLGWEIALAGGWTCGTIKSIEQCIQHSRDYPLELMIYNQQYIDRLAAHFNEQGIPILRRASANLPGWDTLGFKVTVALLECLLSAAQGVKYIDLSLGLGMNLVQDVAAVQVVQKLGREYLDQRGLHDVKVYPWAYFFLGDWPMDPAGMAGQISWNAAVATLAGCNGMSIKSPDEALTTPTGKGFREAMLIVGQTVRLIAGQRLPESEDLRLEREMMESEVRAVMARLLDLGDGDVALGSCRAVEAGVLDTVFSPWRRIKGKVLIARDARGALRYLDSGDVPLPPEVRAYHRARIAERERKDGVAGDLQWVIESATWASRPLAEDAAQRPY